MPVSTWKSRNYYELRELLERIDNITDEYPYFQSLYTATSQNMREATDRSSILPAMTI